MYRGNIHDHGTWKCHGTWGRGIRGRGYATQVQKGVFDEKKGNIGPQGEME